MRKTLIIATLVCAVGTFATAPAFAHEPRRGPHGGVVVDAGPHHIEWVQDDAGLTLYLTDAQDRPVSAAGFKAAAIVTVGGKPQRFDLTVAGDRMTAAAAGLPKPATGAVLLTAPDGKTAQAKIPARAE